MPILVFRAFDGLFGVREYWPYVLLLVVVHLAIVVLLWHVMVRSAIDPWLSLGVVAIIAIPGPGFENLTNVWQVQLISPLALGLGALLLLPERGPLGWRDGVASAPAHHRHGVLGPGHHHARRGRAGRAGAPGWRVVLAVAAVPAVAYRGGTSRTGASSATLRLSRTAGARVRVGRTHRRARRRGATAPLGVVIVLATFVWLVCQLLHRPIPRTLLFPAVLALGAVVSLALTGWRRAAITEGALSRYAYITIVLVLPVVAAALDWLVRRLAGRSVAKVVPVVTAVLRGDRGRAGPDLQQLRRQHRRVEAGREGGVPHHRAARPRRAPTLTTTPCSCSSRRSRRRRSPPWTATGSCRRSTGREKTIATRCWPGSTSRCSPAPSPGSRRTRLRCSWARCTARRPRPPRCAELRAARRAAAPVPPRSWSEGQCHGRPAGRRTDQGCGSNDPTARSRGGRLRRARSEGRPRAQHRTPRRPARRRRGPAHPPPVPRACAAFREARVSRRARARVLGSRGPSRRREACVT